MARKKSKEQTAKQQGEPWRVEDDLPIVGELKNCRQLSEDHWQGTDVDGALIDVRGGLMPDYVVVPLGRNVCSPRNSLLTVAHGLVRVVRASGEKEAASG